MRRMLHVGLTGNIGSGKSTVAAVFAELGAHVIDADLIAHLLLAPGSGTYCRVVEAFGQGVLRADHTIDRRKLGAIVFNAPEKRVLLNGLIHPEVRTEVLRRIVELEKSGQGGVIIVDAALMVESGFYKLFDRLIVVTCDPGLQLARIMDRDSLSAEEARARISAQMPVEEKLKVASYTIETSGTFRQTRERVEEIFKGLMLEEIRRRNQSES